MKKTHVNHCRHLRRVKVEKMKHPMGHSPAMWRSAAIWSVVELWEGQGLCEVDFRAKQGGGGHGPALSPPPCRPAADPAARGRRWGQVIMLRYTKFGTIASNSRNLVLPLLLQLLPLLVTPHYHHPKIGIKCTKTDTSAPNILLNQF